MNMNSTILIACIGKSDPYSLSKNSCKTGPTLSLTLKFLPSHFIFFVSKDIEVENRLFILERAINQLYLEKNLASPCYEIIRISEDSETFDYQETLKKTTNELRSRLAKFPKDSHFIFSKTSGTPQYKIALEIFPNLYMENYNFEIITKSDSGKGLSTLDPAAFSTQEIFNDISDENYLLKDSIENSIITNNEFSSQSIFSKLQTVKELIKEFEYNAAISILENIFPYLKLGRNAEADKNWLNDIYEQNTMKVVYKGLKLARALLAFDLGSGKELARALKSPEIQSFFERYEMNDSKARSELAYLNFEIFRKKSLHKEQLLSFCILLERLRKENIKQRSLEYSLFELNDKESIREETVNQEFHSYFYDFINRNECIEITKASAAKLSPSEPIRSLTLPVLEAAAHYLYEIHEVKTDTYQFYRALASDENKLSAYKTLKSLRDTLAHDFCTISPKELTPLEILVPLVKSTYPSICINDSIYDKIQESIFKKMFSLI